MNLFDKFKKSIKPVQETVVQSLPVYNAEHNFIVLIQYNSSIWYEVLEFIESAVRSGLRVINSHTAEEAESQTAEFEANKPIKFINQRYYIVVSGNDQKYLELMCNLPLSNPILSTLLKDIEANRSYVEYGRLFEDDILDKSKFNHQDILPIYDEMVKASNNDVQCEHDDIKLIMGKLPKSFSAMDVARIVNIKFGNCIESAVDLVKLDSICRADPKCGYNLYWPYINACVSTLYSKIFKNPNYETISKLAQPIYFWEDLMVDPDGEFEPDKSMEEMDETFQAQYERFNPIDESEFKKIDEPTQ